MYFFILFIILFIVYEFTLRWFEGRSDETKRRRFRKRKNDIAEIFLRCRVIYNLFLFGYKMVFVYIYLFFDSERFVFSPAGVYAYCIISHAWTN